MQQSADERELAVALLARAEEERRRILEEAKAQAQKILSDARTQLKALREERARAARQRAEVEVARRLSQARFELAAEEARLLDEAASRAIAGARETLSGIRHQPEYVALLSLLLDECLGEFPPKAITRLTIDPRDESALKAALGGRANLRVERGGPFLGGLMASDDEGRLVVDNTFEARLRARASDIRRALAEVFLRAGTGSWP